MKTESEVRRYLRLVDAIILGHGREGCLLGEKAALEWMLDMRADPPDIDRLDEVEYLADALSANCRIGEAIQ